jgi:hypothetical protein
MFPHSLFSMIFHTFCVVPTKCPSEQCILDFTQSHILRHFSVLATQICNEGFTVVSPPSFMFLYPVHVKSIASSFCAYGWPLHFPACPLLALIFPGPIVHHGGQVENKNGVHILLPIHWCYKSYLFQNSSARVYIPEWSC